jgi:hypothetical protein
MKIQIEIHSLFDGNFYGVAKYMSQEHLAARVESTKLTTDLEGLKAELVEKITGLVADFEPEAEPALFDEGGEG